MCHTVSTREKIGSDVTKIVGYGLHLVLQWPCPADVARRDGLARLTVFKLGN